MKTLQKFLYVALLTAVTFIHAGWYTSEVELINPKITSPLIMGHDGLMSLELVENLGGVVPAFDSYNDSTVSINIETSDIELKDNDPTLITGTMMDYFTVTFYEIDRGYRYEFVQIEDIPANSHLILHMPITPIRVTETATFLANISAAGRTHAPGAASAITKILDNNTTIVADTIERNTPLMGLWGTLTKTYTFEVKNKRRVVFKTASRVRHTMTIKNENGDIIKSSKKSRKLNKLRKKLRPGVYTIEVVSTKEGSFILEYK